MNQPEKMAEASAPEIWASSGSGRKKLAVPISKVAIRQQSSTSRYQFLWRPTVTITLSLSVVMATDWHNSLNSIHQFTNHSVPIDCSMQIDDSVGSVQV